VELCDAQTVRLARTLALTFYPLPSAFALGSGVIASKRSEDGQERKSPLANSGFADDRPANPIVRIFKGMANVSPSPPTELGERAGVRWRVKQFPSPIGWTTVSCCNSTDFADNKLMVDRDKIQFDLIKLLNGERILRLTEPQSGLALEKKLAPADAVVRQKEKLLGAFQAALARVELSAA